jgi:hypothetical protein
MLFIVASGMTHKMWDSLPATTNATESMHHRIYRIIGQRNTLFYRLEGLVCIGETFERSYDAAQSMLHLYSAFIRNSTHSAYTGGHKIFYGRDPQYWKMTRF